MMMDRVMSRTPAAAKQRIIVDRAVVREIKPKFWHYIRYSCVLCVCVCVGRGDGMLSFCVSLGVMNQMPFLETLLMSVWIDVGGDK